MAAVLRSHVLGGWHTPSDEGRPLFDAVTGAEVARLSSAGVDFASALVRVGKFLGYRVTVCDARPVFATAAYPYERIAKLARLIARQHVGNARAERDAWVISSGSSRWCC